jgi:hypothetical protein
VLVDDTKNRGKIITIFFFIKQTHTLSSFLNTHLLCKFECSSALHRANGKVVDIEMAPWLAEEDLVIGNIVILLLLFLKKYIEKK